MTATRRLAAILAADVTGYSRLMGADEESTPERLKWHRCGPISSSMSQGSIASFRAGHRLAQNFCNGWMMRRRSSLLRRLVMHVPEREIGPFGNE
jgi:hypothetical protein